VKFLCPHYLLENTLEESPDCSGPQPHDPRLFRASLKVSLADERGLDDPAGLTIYVGLYIALQTHTHVRQAVPLVTDPGSNLLTTPTAVSVSVF
jgi:hypothetical protein